MTVTKFPATPETYALQVTAKEFSLIKEGLRALSSVDRSFGWEPDRAAGYIRSYRGSGKEADEFLNVLSRA